MLRLVVLFVAVVCASALVCLPDTCNKVQCPAVTPENCLGGTITKNRGFCGCCEICVTPLGQTCAERVTEIEAAKPLPGQFIPTCETDGSYSARQCHGSVCYCVDPQGVQISDYQSPISQAANMDCRCARDQSAYMKTGLIGKLFSCTDSGSYKPYACTGSVCYCIDNLGVLKPGSQTVNIADIGLLKC